MDSRSLRFGAEAAALVRDEIARAGGNEVCFLAAVSEEGELVEPRVVARGNSRTVLAAVREFEPGQYLVHNHPSGELTPSNADLAVAERLWCEGLGFAITDNHAASLYVVVEPAAERRLLPLDVEAIEADLAPGGVLSRSHGNYEDRPDQRALARLVARMYDDSAIGMAEAGTGIGKSVAYLLPAIRWAALNREKTVVSTNTINLQEQLLRKDLPFLARTLGVDLKYALVKGRGNYVSIRRAKLAALNATSLFPEGREKEIDALLEWIDTTEDGSLSDLPFRPSAELWDEVASDSDVCLRAKCPHFERCFYQKARRDATSADILVVNHHLLFADLAVRRASENYNAQAVLPSYRRLILDEAHNLEDTATRHLGDSLSRRGFARLLRRLEHRGRGVLPTLEKTLLARSHDLLVRSSLDLIAQRLRPELEAAWRRGVDLFRRLEDVIRENGGGVVRLEPAFAEHRAWREGLAEDLSATIAHLETLLLGIESLRERIAADGRAAADHEELLLELNGVAGRLEGAAVALRSCLRPEREADRLVRWIELRGRPGAGEQDGDANVVVASAPLDVGNVLRESLWERMHTVVMTSATLATGDGFTFARQRLGLGNERPVEEAIFPSPFDFPTQALLAVPTDLPHPGNDGDPRHAAATLEAVRTLAEITDGGLFVLFTSYRALRALAAGLRRDLPRSPWPLFVHGEAPRAQLIEGFVRSGRGILLGTDSFWEGVDVPGDPLRGVVIPKLPFRVPTEPITSARAEAIEAQGGNSFTSYMLPHAAIRLKQGFGRLIRSRSDRGAVLLLDGRILTRSYGRYLFDSLPPARLLIDDWDTCRAELKMFYSGAFAHGPTAPRAVSGPVAS